MSQTTDRPGKGEKSSQSSSQDNRPWIGSDFKTVTRPDRSITVSGRLVMMNADQVPFDLKLTCLDLKPPFSFQSAICDGESNDITCMTMEDLEQALNQPMVVPDRDGAFIIKGISEKDKYLFPSHPFYRCVKPVPLFAATDSSKAINESISGLIVILEEAGVIEGHVFEPGGSPAASAKVTLKEEYNPYLAYSDRKGMFTSFTTTAGEDGRFRVVQVPAGQIFTLEAALPGYAPVQVKPVIVRRGDSLKLRVTLDPASSIIGEVQNLSGTPASGVEVGLIKIRTTFSENDGEPLARAETNANGKFHFNDLSNGQYIVRLFENGFVRKATEAVDLACGETIDTCQLFLDKGFSVSGIVLDRYECPLAGAHIRAVAKMDISNWAGFVSDREHPITGMTDAAGHFQLWGLEEGFYDLDLVSACGTLTGTARVHAGEDDLHILLRRGGTLSGNVHAAGTGQSVESFTVLMRLNPSSPGYAMFDPIKDTKRFRHVFEGNDGKFLLSDLHPGVYDLTFTADGFSTFKIEDLALEYEAAVHDLHVELPGESGVEGCVIDSITGDPVDSAMISHESDFSGMLQAILSEEVVYTDSLGHFEFRRLPPGVIRLVATHPRFMETYVEAIVLHEGENIKGIEIQMQRGATIQGRVMTGTSSQVPAPGVHIIVSNMTGQRVKTALTDRNGFYRISGLAEGPYVVRKMPKEVILGDEGFMGSRLSDLMVQTVMVESNQVVECGFNEGIAWDKGKILHGKIIEEGKPVSKAIVSLLTADPSRKFFKPKTTSTDRTGQYKLEGISPGFYTLRVIKAESIALGESCEIVYEMEVPDNEEPELYNDLHLPTGSLVGVVIDENTQVPLEDIRIVIERCGTARIFDPLSQAKGHRVGEVYTDAAGAFRISNLHSGAYRIRAGGGNLVGMNSNGYGIRYIEGVTIDQDQPRSETRITLVKGGNIQGRITDRLGHAVAGASIHMQDPGRMHIESFSECVSDGTGFFRYEGLNPGVYHVVVKHADYALKTQFHVEVRANEDTDLNIELDKGTAIFLSTAGLCPHLNQKEFNLEWIDSTGRNLYGLVSFVDVMSRFMQGGDSEEGRLFVGRFSAGEYSLKIESIEYGFREVRIELTAGEPDRVIILNSTH
ncbi:MAG: carboxypeptidase-like regulatory domain-containing protein [Planctomycetota bacterium]